MLQPQLDDWQRAHADQPHDPAAYRAFLDSRQLPISAAYRQELLSDQVLVAESSGIVGHSPRAHGCEDRAQAVAINV
jgi:hypothetical protein